MDRSITLLIAAAVICGSARAQQNPPKPESPAKLELTMEVATTDDDGHPTALAITITNVGSVPVDMPTLKQGCSPDNGIRIVSSWTPDLPSDHGFGSGSACGMFDQPALLYRVQHDWVRLRPGESMTDTERLVWDQHHEEGPGTVEYWVEFTPPAATAKDIADLLQSGHIIPTEELETAHASFHIQ